MNRSTIAATLPLATSVTFVRLGLVLLLLLLTGAAIAVEGLPAMQPEGRYIDDDPAASAFNAPVGRRAQFRQRINASLQKNPRNVSALVHRAYLFMEGDDFVRARRDFDAALAAAEPGGPHERHVLWSRGWASYELGHYADTFLDWQRAIALHGGEPHWAAYSLALLYWTTGQSDLALRWYAVAAAGEADWSTAEGMARRIRSWSPPQRERMQALFAAWASSGEPPAPSKP
jgi:tetratricopeptide (TPR) repeat protein